MTGCTLYADSRFTSAITSVKTIKYCVCLKNHNHFHAVTPIVRTVWKRPLGSKTEWVNIVKLCTNMTRRTKTCFFTASQSWRLYQSNTKNRILLIFLKCELQTCILTAVSLCDLFLRLKDGMRWLLGVFPYLSIWQQGLKLNNIFFYCHISKQKWQSRLTFSFTDLTSFLTFASQKAPLYFALTSVPIGKKAGSNVAWNIYRLRIVQW